MRVSNLVKILGVALGMAVLSGCVSMEGLTTKDVKEPYKSMVQVSSYDRINVGSSVNLSFKIDEEPHWNAKAFDVQKIKSETEKKLLAKGISVASSSESKYTVVLMRFMNQSSSASAATSATGNMATSGAMIGGTKDAMLLGAVAGFVTDKFQDANNAKGTFVSEFKIIDSQGVEKTKFSIRSNHGENYKDALLQSNTEFLPQAISEFFTR